MTSNEFLHTSVLQFPFRVFLLDFPRNDRNVDRALILIDDKRMIDRYIDREEGNGGNKDQKSKKKGGSG